VVVDYYDDDDIAVAYTNADESESVASVNGNGTMALINYDDAGERHGLGMSTYVNGDVTVFEYDHSIPKHVHMFRCSHTCLDPSYAGRTITCARWTSETLEFYDRDEKRERIIWLPLGDSEDALLFRRYVRERHIGWHPAMRDAIVARWDNELNAGAATA
jgi:hypothetical protein